MGNQVYYWPVPTNVLNMVERPLVLVTGVFDILHEAHYDFLQQAAALGANLWVGLECDQRVTELKGPGRPVNNHVVRAEKLLEWSMVDLVFILPENFSLKSARIRLLQQLKPEFLAVSSHTPYLQQKQQLMNQVGGQMIVVKQQDPSISTTRILQQRRKRNWHKL